MTTPALFDLATDTPSPEKRMAAPKGERPITLALNIVRNMVPDRKEDVFYMSGSARDRLIELLKSRDASSDTPDSKRKRPSTPVVGWLETAKKKAKAAKKKARR